MIIRFKSALNKIRAEDELINKTEAYLKDSLTKNEKAKTNKNIKWRLLPMKKGLAIAICLAVLIISGSGVYAYTQTPISYLSLDINPSVEIGVSRFGKVVKAEGYNSDGKKILSGVNVKGSTVKEAVNALISSAVDNDFIAKDGSTVISLTSETDNENIATEIENDGEAGAKEALEENGKAAIINKDNVAIARREEAKKIGITPGKLNLINKLQSVDPTATVEQYKDASVKEIMKSIKNCKENGSVKNKDNDNTESKDIKNAGNKNNGNIENKGSGNIEKKNNGNSENKGNGNIENKGNGNTENKGNGNIENKGNGNIENKGNGNTENKGNGNTENKGNGNTENKGNGNAENKGNGNSGNKDNGKPGNKK